jgi:hypothetical protein
VVERQIRRVESRSTTAVSSQRVALGAYQLCMNIIAISLNGELDVGIVSCPDLLPKLWELADDFCVALDELLESV